MSSRTGNTNDNDEASRADSTATGSKSVAPNTRPDSKYSGSITSQTDSNAPSVFGASDFELPSTRATSVSGGTPDFPGALSSLLKVNPMNAEQAQHCDEMERRQRELAVKACVDPDEGMANKAMKDTRPANVPSYAQAASDREELARWEKKSKEEANQSLAAQTVSMDLEEEWDSDNFN